MFGPNFGSAEILPITCACLQDLFVRLCLFCGRNIQTANTLMV